MLRNARTLDKVLKKIRKNPDNNILEIFYSDYMVAKISFDRISKIKLNKKTVYNKSVTRISKSQVKKVLDSHSGYFCNDYLRKEIYKELGLKED